MKFSIQDLVSQLKTLFDKLSLPQKITIALTLAAAVITIVTLIIWAAVSNKPGQSILYSNLSTADAGEITSKLTEMRIPYQLTSEGSAIVVSSDKIYQTRLDLAQQGLPKGGGVGFEIFDNTSLGMTEFIQKVNFRRALQGELARTIMAIDGIENARVHIALPEKSLFIDQEKPAEASVALKLVKYSTLSGPQVKGIIHLVASSVEGLKPEHVVVIDDKGRILNELIQERDKENTLTVTQLTYQKDVERKLKGQLDNLLVSILGQGNAFSNVTVELDFDKIEEQIETFDPENVVRSEQRINEQEIGRNVEGGIPGVRANVADQEDPEAGISRQRSKEAETINYEVGKTTRHIVRSRGQIKRITVGVAVNGRYVDQLNDDGKNQLVYQARDEAELTKITELVQSAIGYLPDRGDRVVVTSLEFGTPPKGMFDQIMEMQDVWTELLKYLGIFLFFLFTFLFVVRPVMRWVVDMTRPEDEIKRTFGTGEKKPKTIIPTKLPKTLSELESEMENQIDSESSLSVDAVRGKVIKKKLSELVEENPAMAAQLVRVWIKEEGKGA
ncbi:flagellar basal-body MS-ring/collar protein FliF [Chrysiogenes arsenatis]|uniref:flagellar basal-body MS-ring/collar protein FliF n=1 Tax=Chrysiogenes arsenatis TaxID=309797 RepID=UPI00041630CE|nr:flagellar basal-body MS-ring/collar protein FliF [Chrysiogenes arsenatis]